MSTRLCYHIVTAQVNSRNYCIYKPRLCNRPSQHLASHTHINPSGEYHRSHFTSFTIAPQPHCHCTVTALSLRHNPVVLPPQPHSLYSPTQFRLHRYTNNAVQGRVLCPPASRMAQNLTIPGQKKRNTPETNRSVPGVFRYCVFTVGVLPPADNL